MSTILSSLLEYCTDLCVSLLSSCDDGGAHFAAALQKVFVQSTSSFVFYCEDKTRTHSLYKSESSL